MMRHKNNMFACFQILSCFRIVRIICAAGPRSFLFEIDLLVLNFAGMWCVVLILVLFVAETPGDVSKSVQHNKGALRMMAFMLVWMMLVR